MKTLTDSQIMAVYRMLGTEAQNPLVFGRAVVNAVNTQPPVTDQVLRLLDSLLSTVVDPRTNQPPPEGHVPSYYVLKFSHAQRETFTEALRRILDGQMRIDLRTGLPAEEKS